MREYKNLKEFKALILRYESITIEEIESISETWRKPNILTGFGSERTCTLCNNIVVCNDCEGCVWGYYFACSHGLNGHTYLAIRGYKNDNDLLIAFRKRANHMRNHLKSLNINFDEI